MREKSLSLVQSSLWFPNFVPFLKDELLTILNSSIEAAIFNSHPNYYLNRSLYHHRIDLGNRNMYYYTPKAEHFFLLAVTAPSFLAISRRWKQQQGRGREMALSKAIIHST